MILSFLRWSKTDWEVELARRMRERATLKRLMLWIISPAMPCTTITGTGLSTERSGQWVSESCDTFAPFGPFLATPEEILIGQ